MNDNSLPATRHNLELKARCADLALAHARLTPLSVRPGGTEEQTDTYFRVPNGRLKLREIVGQPAVLIWYVRPNETAVRSSNYYLVPAPDPAGLKAALTAALGLRGEVRKRRAIIHFHNVRIHLDEVAGLGTFLEFEAVITDEAEIDVSHARLAQLTSVLEIQESDRIGQSYAELLGL